MHGCIGFTRPASSIKEGAPINGYCPHLFHWLAHRFPATTKAAGEVILVSPAISNLDTEGFGINSHSAMKDREIQAVWNVYNRVVDEYLEAP
jgi:hypothetical protein